MVTKNLGSQISLPNEKKTPIQPSIHKFQSERGMHKEGKQGVDSKEQVEIALNKNDEPKTWDPKISILYEQTPNSATNPQIPNGQRGGETKNQVSGHSPNTWELQ